MPFNYLTHSDCCTSDQHGIQDIVMPVGKLEEQGNGTQIPSYYDHDSSKRCYTGHDDQPPIQGQHGTLTDHTTFHETL